MKHSLHTASKRTLFLKRRTVTWAWRNAVSIPTWRSCLPAAARRVHLLSLRSNSRKFLRPRKAGRERVDTIAGRVSGSRPGQQIVVYARSGPWWVQPWPDKPFIPIQADATWGTSTHLGFEYAAMLVDPGYHPPPTMDVAPTQGGSVAAVTVVKGTGEPQIAPVKQLHFSGYDWGVRTIASDRGGV